MNYIYKAILLMFAALVMSSCSKGNDKASNIDPRTGKHPAGWAIADTGGAHPAAFIAGPSACYQCHGKALDGGITGVSCFTASRSGITCHANGPSGHPAGWASPDVHGAAAKALSAGQNGLARCQICHGSDFSGGIAKTSCLNTSGCHGAGIMAAHSPKPWLSKIGGRTHSNSDPSNAAACAVCHTNGAKSSRQPSTAAPAGTAPGCFNNTLCHGVEGHATGWNVPAAHGAAAKAAHGGVTVNGLISPISSFGDCVQCHGVKYDGGTAQQTCLNTAGCHGANVASPHPAKPWRSTTGGVTHTTTNTSNDAQCAVCHTNGANSTRIPKAGDPTGLSGCFNNTLCHGAEGHATGWAAPAQHGTAAKSAPGTTTGFSSCQQCHGAPFNGGSGPSCLNTLSCHGLLVSSPHPAKPWSSTVAGASTHTTTDPANAGTCAICHTGGANSNIVPPLPLGTGTAGCYNNTLCHFHAIPFKPPGVDPSVHGGLAKQDLTVCQTCHGVKGTTAFDGLAVGGGVTTIACSSCHTFAKAHPTVWQGSAANPGETVIYSHRTAGNIANACTICHDVTQGRTAPLPAAPSCFSPNFANPLTTAVTTCHANGPGVAPHPVPYPNHIAVAGGPNGNTAYCLGCHKVAANAAGSKPPGCQNCHLTDPTVTGLVQCTSCHAKPPAGTSYPNLAGVHASHAVLNVTQNANQTAVCDQCHFGQPLGSGLGFGTLDHLNRARARAAAVQANPTNLTVTGILATTGGLVPIYTDATQTCANTYCHGNTLDKPTTAILSPSWTSPFLTGNAASDCTKCHGYPPQTSAHILSSGPTSCKTCHPHVNPTGTGFDDPTKHINGVIDASGGVAHAVPFLTHNVAAVASCLASNGGCHSTGTGASPYPATTGTPPNCMSCHTLADPLSAGNGLGNCKSCHGTGGTLTAAAPTGTTFPNIMGTNNNAHHPSHNGSVCGTCHPNVDSTGRFVGTIATGTVASGSGAGVNHGPNKTMTSGTSQTDVVFTTVGIVPATPRGTGATCTHGSLAVSGCHGGPGQQTW